MFVEMQSLVDISKSDAASQKKTVDYEMTRLAIAVTLVGTAIIACVFVALHNHLGQGVRFGVVSSFAMSIPLLTFALKVIADRYKSNLNVNENKNLQPPITETKV